MNCLILCIFRFIKMAYSYLLNYPQNLITGQRFGSGIFRGRNKLHGRSTKMCYDFTINDSGEMTPNDVPLCTVKQREEEWLFGPATRLATRSIIYPCSRGRCSLPCPCLLCHRKQHPRCRVRSRESCVCQDCKEHFEDHVNFHSVFHYGCKQCHQIVKIIPNCNFTILNRFPCGGHLPEASSALDKERIILGDGMEWCPDLGCSKSVKLSPSHDSLRKHLLHHHTVNKFFHYFIENDNEVSPFECNKCIKPFATRYDLERHIECVHLKTTFKCSYCDQVFTRKDNYETHKLVNHVDSNHSCLTCKKKFKTKRALLWHLEFGIWCRQQCEVCTKSFTRKSNLVRHEKMCHTVTGSGGVCGVCLETFQFDIDLQRHRKGSSNPDGSCKFVCGYCNQNKCSAKQLSEHIESDHFGPNRNEEAEKVYEEKRCKRKLVLTDDIFQCEKCGNMFPSRESLRKHLEEHTDKTRTRGSNMREEAGSFECECCASKFKFKKNFERHSREALDIAGNPKHKCDKCDKEFCTGKILKVHVKFAHQPFSCLVCGQSFTAKQTLERHLKKAVKTKCAICDNVFCNKQAYDFHMSKVHI